MYWECPEKNKEEEKLTFWNHKEGMLNQKEKKMEHPL
jgi:hypothetical protein